MKNNNGPIVSRRRRRRSGGGHDDNNYGGHRSGEYGGSMCVCVWGGCTFPRSRPDECACPEPKRNFPSTAKTDRVMGGMVVGEGMGRRVYARTPRANTKRFLLIFYRVSSELKTWRVHQKRSSISRWRVEVVRGVGRETTRSIGPAAAAEFKYRVVADYSRVNANAARRGNERTSNASAMIFANALNLINRFDVARFRISSVVVRPVVIRAERTIVFAVNSVSSSVVTLRRRNSEERDTRETLSGPRTFRISRHTRGEGENP